MLFVIIAIILVIALIIFLHCKRIKIGAIALVTGGVKTGKTTLSVYLALREYKRIHRWWWFRKVFLFKKEEEPLLYSNISLSVPYVPIEREHLLRIKRFNYKSVVLLSEFSLVADSQLIKDKELNERLLLFFKLFGHETKGGKLICDTQCIADCHYSLKRCISEYLYIHKCFNLFFLPFVKLTVREERYSDDNSTINTYNEDIEDSLKTMYLWKSVWRKFDCYTYSILTDSFSNECEQIRSSCLKTQNIVSFKEDRLK